MKRTLLLVLLIGFLTSGSVQFSPAGARNVPPIPLTNQVVTSSPSKEPGSPPAANPPDGVRTEATQAPPPVDQASEPVLPVTSIQTLTEPIAVEEKPAPEWAHRQHLAAFVDSVVTGVPGELVGVFVPDVFSLPVLQQPKNQAGFVSTQNDTVTQFASPRQYGVVGLLAHNYLSGEEFFRLETGQQIALVYGDRQVEFYQINRIERFQALSPSSPYSDFINLADAEQRVISSSQLFDQIYTTANQVVFQTCIEANGDPSWGRIFVIADPIDPPVGGY